MMVQHGQEIVNFDDVSNEIFDMCRPNEPDRKPVSNGPLSEGGRSGMDRRLDHPVRLISNDLQ